MIALAQQPRVGPRLGGVAEQREYERWVGFGVHDGDRATLEEHGDIGSQRHSARPARFGQRPKGGDMARPIDHHELTRVVGQCSNENAAGDHIRVARNGAGQTVETRVAQPLVGAHRDEGPHERRI